MLQLGDKLMLKAGIIMIVGFVLFGELNIFLLIGGILCIVNRKKIDKTGAANAMCWLAFGLRILGMLVAAIIYTHDKPVDMEQYLQGSIEDGFTLVITLLLTAIVITTLVGIIMGLVGTKRNREYYDALMMQIKYENYLKYKQYYDNVVAYYGYAPAGLVPPVSPQQPPKDYEGLKTAAIIAGVTIGALVSLGSMALGDIEEMQYSVLDGAKKPWDDDYPYKDRWQ